MASDGAAKELLGLAKNRLNKFYNPSQYVPPPGAGPKAYSKKSEESNGIISMLDSLVAELDKEMQVAKVDEKNAQEEYEQTMKDSTQKRSDSQKEISDKKGAKADAEEALQSHTDAKAE